MPDSNKDMPPRVPYGRKELLVEFPWLLSFQEKAGSNIRMSPASFGIFSAC
jgi:hypothetical protein